MTNGPLRFSIAIALAAFCLLLTGGSNRQDTDHQDTAARRQQVAQMTQPEKAQLYRLWERFEALPPEQRENLRQLQRQIADDKQADELKAVMARYYQWCRTLPAYQRLELQELPIKKRIAQIKKLKRQAEDADGLKKWFEAKVDQVADHLSDEQQKRLSAYGANAKRWILFRWMNGMAAKSGRGINNPLNDQDLAELRTHLSDPTRQILEKQPPTEQWKTIVKRLKRHFHSQNLRRRFSRRRSIHPSGISNEDLATHFQNLPSKRQDTLLSLPAEEMLQQLQQIYMDHRFPKFRPKKPNNHTPNIHKYRHPPTKKRPPRTPTPGQLQPPPIQ